MESREALPMQRESGAAERAEWTARAARVLAATGLTRLDPLPWFDPRLRLSHQAPELVERENIHRPVVCHHQTLHVACP